MRLPPLLTKPFEFEPEFVGVGDDVDDDLVGELDGNEGVAMGQESGLRGRAPTPRVGHI